MTVAVEFDIQILEAGKVVLLTREQIIEIVSKLQKCEYSSEQEMDRALAELQNGVLDPDISNYIYWDELTPEEVADKALSYKTIQL